MKFKAFHITGLVILVFLITLQGCDNSLEPFEDNPSGYSVYGALNINEDVNYIRVKDLSLPIDDVPETIDVTVQLTSTTTGEIETLKDTLVKFEGVNTHTFISRMNIEPETTYRLTVTKPDGDSFSVSTTTPKLIENITRTITESPPDACYSYLTTRLYPYDINLPIEAQVGFELISNTAGIEWYDLSRPEASELTDQFVINFQIRNLLWVTVLGRIPPEERPPENYCIVLRSSTIYIRYKHFGPEYLTNAASDSLEASYNKGNFIGFYTDTIDVEVPQLEEVINQ